jgi:uncharacterized protein
MTNWEQPHWPTDGHEGPPEVADSVTRRPRSRRPGLVAIVLVSALVALATVSVSTSRRTIGGLALPAATSTEPSTSQQPPPATTTPPRPKPSYLLADHPLLAPGVTLPDVTCALPPFRRDTASLDAFYRALVGCLDAAWQPVLRAGDLPFEAPHLNLAVHPGRTGCGNPDTDPELDEFTAMYCPADQTLYLPVDRLKKVDRGGSSSHLAVVAHEYSHHIQQLSGLLGAAAEQTDKVGDHTPAGNAFTRRTELQANCFAGLFLAAAAGRGAIPRNLATQAVAEFRYGGLPETHGSSAHQASWAKKGYTKRTTAACNTWAAAPSEIS